MENAGYHFFSPKYEFSSLKWEVKILLAYIAMNINSASRPDTPRIVYYEMWALSGTIEWPAASCPQQRSREQSNMTSDLEEEMQSESESSVDIRESY